MAFKKNRERSEPDIPSASLPDIVFQLLIFFLVTTIATAMMTTSTMTMAPIQI